MQPNEHGRGGAAAGVLPSGKLMKVYVYEVNFVLKIKLLYHYHIMRSWLVGAKASSTSAQTGNEDVYKSRVVNNLFAHRLRSTSTATIKFDCTEKQ